MAEYQMMIYAPAWIVTLIFLIAFGFGIFIGSISKEQLNGSN